MTQKEFIGKLATKLQWDESNTSEALEVISNILTEKLSENDVVSIENFGVFTIHKNQEYILHDSETGERYLMPPEVVVLFEPTLSEYSEQEINISFESDGLLKSSINSAFQNFEPTLINEGVEFPGIKIVSTNEPEKDITEPEPEAVSVAETAVLLEIEPEPPVTTEIIKNTESHSKPVIRPEVSLRPKSRFRKRSRVLVPVLGGVVIVMATLFFFSMELQNAKTVVTEKEKRAKLPIVSSELDLTNDLVQEPAIASQPVSRNPESVILRDGETLRIVALNLFGNKEFWVYIYQENMSNIKNPNIVNEGTELKIPDISIYDINPDSPQSIAKAKEKGDRILESL